jgi:hypothetical protein
VHAVLVRAAVDAHKTPGGARGAVALILRLVIAMLACLTGEAVDAYCAALRGVVFTVLAILAVAGIGFTALICSAEAPLRTLYARGSLAPVLVAPLLAFLAC